jgi:hypothetical protein
MFCISIVVGLSGIVIFFFLVPEPDSLGIVIDEYTDKEAIIDVASDPKVYKDIMDRKESCGTVLEE